MERRVKEKRIHRVYEQEFRDRAVEMVIHSGKSQAQVARELGVSGYSLTKSVEKKHTWRGLNPLRSAANSAVLSN